MAESDWEDIPTEGDWVDNTPEKTQTLLQAVGKGILHAPENLSNIARGLGTAALHPINTLGALKDIAVGTAARVNESLPGYKAPKSVNPEIQRKEELSRSFTKDIATSFGLKGADEFKKKLSERPVDVAMDFGSAVVPALKTVGATAKLPLVSKIAGYVDMATNPVALGGKVAGAVIKNRIAPYAKSIMPDIMALADKYDIELPATSMSNSPVVALKEARAGKSYYGTNLIDVIDNANAKLKSIADDTVAKAGKETDLLKVGATIDEGLDSATRNFFTSKDDLYKAADISNINTRIKTPNALQSIDEILKPKTMSVLKDTPTIKELKALRKGLGDNSFITLSMADATWKELKNKIRWGGDTVSSGDNAMWKKITTALSKDIDSELLRVRPDLADAANIADKYFADNIDLLNSKWGNAIHANKGKPDLIVKSILGKDMSAIEIPSFMKFIGGESSDAIRVATLKNIFEDSTNAATQTFKPTGIANKIAKEATREKLKAILTPEQYQVVEDLSKLTPALGKSSKIMGGSQTAFLESPVAKILTVLSSGGAGSAAGGLKGGIGAVVAATVAIVGQSRWNKFLTSPAGRKWLTTGYSIPGNAGKFKDLLANIAIATKQKEVTGGK